MGKFGHANGAVDAVEQIRTKKQKWGEAPRLYTLNLCPKCGSDRVSVWYVGSVDEGGWRGICSDCLYLPGRLCSTEQEAVNLWNGGEMK